MRNPHRLAIPVLVAFIAACGGPTGPAPSQAPTTAASPTASRTPTLPATPPGTAVPAPTLATCPILGGDYEPPSGGISIGGEGIGDAGGRIDTTSVRTDSGFVETFGQEGGASLDVGILRTGKVLDVEVWLSPYGGDDAPDLMDTLELLSLDVTLTGDELEPIHASGEPTRSSDLPAAWTLTFDALPEMDARLALEVRIGWRDRCFTYAAAGSDDLIVRSAATLATCPRGDAAWDDLRAMATRGLPFGSTRARADISYTHMFFDGVAIIDGPYGILMFEPEAAPTQVAPGATVTFSSPDPDLAFSLPDPAGVRLYRRGGVIRHNEEGGVTMGAFNPPVVAASDLTMQADGSFTMTAPTEPGRYVVAVEMPYESACSVGIVIAGPGLEVVE